MIASSIVALACCTGMIATRFSGANDVPRAETSTVNEPVSDEHFDFLVSGQRCGPTVLAGRNPQGQFCVISLRIRNTGDKAFAFRLAEQRARNAQGQVYEVDREASRLANIGNDAFLAKVNPGNAVRGVIVFDIPADQHITELELHDAALSTGVIVRWPGARRTAAIPD